MNKFKWATGFGAQVVYGLIIGLILGFMARSTGDDSSLRTALDEVGSTYVTLLKLLIPPLVVTAVVVSIANLRQVAGAAKLAVSTLVWFAITSFVSVVIAIGLGLVIKPGVNSGVDASAAQEPDSVGSWWGFLQSIVPQNFLGLGVKISETDGAVSGSLNFNVLQLLVIAIVFGIAAVKVGSKAEPFIEFSGSLLTIVQKVLWWVIRLAPIGTAALIGHAVAEYGWEALGSLGKFAIAIYVGLFLVIAVVYPVILKIHGISPIDFFRRVWPVTSLGFFTRSSMGGHAGYRACGLPPPGSARGVRLLRSTAGCYYEDGWLRCHLPGYRSYLRVAVLRGTAGLHGLPAHHLRLRYRFGRNCWHHRRYGHADPDPVDSRPAACRCRPPAGC